MRLRVKINIMMAAAYPHRKYGDPEYDDKTIEALMRYFKIDSYAELLEFLVSTKKRDYKRSILLSNPRLT